MIRNVLFDLDGTVIDSSKCIYGVYARLFAELGLALPPEREMPRLIGPPIETTLSKYLDDVTEACALFRRIYADVDLGETNVPYEGIADQLKRVRAGGRRVFLATSKGESTAEKILDIFSLRELFDGVYGSRYDLGRSKKHEVIDAIAARENLNKKECILIGDTIFDVEGAEKSGVGTAIVRYGFGFPEDFQGHDIAFFIDRVGDIADKIEEYDGQNIEMRAV